MQLSRRDFIKLSTPALCLPAIFGVLPLGKSPAENQEAASTKNGVKAILYDASKCVGCHYCETACWTENDISFTLVNIEEAHTSGTTELFFWKSQCMHCTEATCVKVCPTGALSQHELGFVTYDKDKCSGCGYCAEFCPFHVPHLSGNKLTGIQKMDKCDFCANRVASNQQPACVDACPENALTFGDCDQLLEKGRQRVEVLKGTYPDARLYGEDELGGLHLISILPQPASFYGLPEDPRVPLAAAVWQDVTKPIGFVLGGLTTLVLLVNYVVARANIKAGKEEQDGKRG